MYMYTIHIQHIVLLCILYTIYMYTKYMCMYVTYMYMATAGRHDTSLHSVTLSEVK